MRYSLISYVQSPTRRMGEMRFSFEFGLFEWMPSLAQAVSRIRRHKHVGLKIEVEKIGFFDILASAISKP